MYDTHTYYEFAKLRQHYLFIRIFNDSIWDNISVATVGFYSIEENSALLIPEISYEINENFTNTLKAYLSIGDDASEFRRYYDYYFINKLIIYF